jgi:murein DD-endopeptidase MepM/ murein hydrolase activator NlpD
VVVSTSGTSNAKFKNKHLSNIKKGYDPLGQYKLKDVKAGLTFFAQNVNKWYLFDEIPSWLKGIDLINPLKATKNMYQYASHRGVDYNSDISLLNKQVVKCVYDGVVQSFHFDPNGGGYLVLVKHTYKGNVFHTYYMHLSNKRLVGNGEVVKKGDVIGRVGNTGAAEGLHSTHLHFEIRGANLQTFYDPVAVYGPDKINRV